MNKTYCDCCGSEITRDQFRDKKGRLILVAEHKNGKTVRVNLHALVHDGIEIVGFDICNSCIYQAVTAYAKIQNGPIHDCVKFGGEKQ